ncbi:MAG: acetate/propionate family kinase [Verrucomicrobiales bacterium]
MKILVLNAGSGSQKIALFDLPEDAAAPHLLDPVWKAQFSTTDPDQPSGEIRLRVQRHGRSHPIDTIDESTSVEERTRRLISLLWEGEEAPLCGPSELAAVGHRVVHGGDRYGEAAEVDAAVEETIERFGEIAPLHNPSGLAGIRVARDLCGEAARHFAVFDTAFHRTLPTVATVYPGPRAWLESGIRRFGFHGTSYRWASGLVAKLMDREDDPELRLILCHLGGGCSLCATRGGRSIDTTMGFTPLDGIAMSTRSGALDPGLLVHLLRRGEPLDDLEHTLNRNSGLAGLSGAAGDTRVVRAKAESGDADAREALDVFVHRLRGGLGQMFASLGEPPDALAFTDAIGETEPEIRSAACGTFASLGLRLDEEKNASSPADTDIAKDDSAIRVFIVEGREEWQIARECHAKLVS